MAQTLWPRPMQRRSYRCHHTRPPSGFARPGGIRLAVAALPRPRVPPAPVPARPAPGSARGALMASSAVASASYPPLTLLQTPTTWSCTPTLRIIRSAQKPAKRLGFYHLILQHGSRQCPRPLPQGQVFVGLKGSPYSPPPCAPSPMPLVRSHASGPQSAPCGALIAPTPPVMMCPRSTWEETSHGEAKAAQNEKVPLTKHGCPATANPRRYRAGQGRGDGSRL